MAPVVDVDDGALAGDAQKDGADHVTGRLPGRVPGRAREHGAQAADGGDEGERNSRENTLRQRDE